MKSKIIVLILVTLGLAHPIRCRAVVQPILFFISDVFTNYTVPAGKVLLIERMSAASAGNNLTNPKIIVETQLFNSGNSGITTSDWGFNLTDKYQEVALTRSMRIPGGGIVGILKNTSLAYNEVHFMGLLVDTTDLYAANVGGATEIASVASGTLSQTVALTTPRPVRVSSTVSTDLTSTWSPNLTEQKSRDLDPSIWTIQTAADSSQKFLQIVAKAPETVPVTPGQ